MIKLKNLEGRLQQVEGYRLCKPKLEQYMTPPHIAAEMLFHIQQGYGDIQGKCVCDLGCGTGMLSVGAAVMSASSVVGFDIDEDALEVATKNVGEFDIQTVQFVQCDVLNLLPLRQTSHKIFDTVLVNPPFGTKTKGTDVNFLQVALSLAQTAVYSFHKIVTKDYICGKAGTWGFKAEEVARLQFNLPPTMKCHKKDSKDVNVLLLRFDCKYSISSNRGQSLYC
jgi:putative methylase